MLKSKDNVEDLCEVDSNIKFHRRYQFHSISALKKPKYTINLKISKISVNFSHSIVLFWQ